MLDEAGTEHEDGWVLVADGRIEQVGSGQQPEADERIDLDGALVTPGLVNTHHHLYQTLTRAQAQQADLFTWLKTLYPIWARLDGEAEYAAARTGLAELMLSGCTTAFDHHYVFPRGQPDVMRCAAAGGRGCSAPTSSSGAARWTSASRRAACRRTRSSRIATRSWPRRRR